MTGFDPQSIRRTYDTVADDYAAAFGDDLDNLPFDRAVLDGAAARMITGRPVLDIGCGPAQVARYLSERHTSTIGVDLAPRMLEIARRRTSGIPLVAAARTRRTQPHVRVLDHPALAIGGFPTYRRRNATVRGKTSSS